MLSCVILGGSSVGIVIIWWLYGIALRFSLKGYYTFGDVVPEDMTEEEWKTELKEDEDSLYQYKSGKFMYIYYVICWCLVSLAFFCACFLICCGYVKTKL